jgi:hypothetical protein
MSERGKQLQATVDRQIAAFAELIRTLDESALGQPCAGREKLGDGTVAASAKHTAHNYRRIGTFVTTTDRDHGAEHSRHPSDGHGDDRYAAETTSQADLIEQVSAAREDLSRIAELTDRQLDTVPPKDGFRFCDGQRTREQVLTGLLKHQDHQVRALEAALSQSR